MDEEEEEEEEEEEPVLNIKRRYRRASSMLEQAMISSDDIVNSHVFSVRPPTANFPLSFCSSTCSPICLTCHLLGFHG